MSLKLWLPGGDNEASTRIKALVGSDGTLVGAGNTSASLAVGPKVSLAQATLLDGVNDYVALPAASWLQPTGPFALGAYYFSTNFKTGSSYGEFAAKTDATAANTAFELRNNRVSGAIEFHIYTSTGGLQSTSSVDISALNGQFVHVVAVYDGAFLRLYINGAASGTPQAKTGTPATTTEVMTIGARNATSLSLPFVGRWCDFRYYDNALSAAEVLAWYNETTAPSAVALASISTSLATLSGDVASVAGDLTTVAAEVEAIGTDLVDVKGVTDSFVEIPATGNPLFAGSPGLAHQIVSGNAPTIMILGDSVSQNMMQAWTLIMGTRIGLRGFANDSLWATAAIVSGKWSNLTKSNDFVDFDNAGGRWGEVNFLGGTSDASATNSANVLLSAKLGPGEMQKADEKLVENNTNEHYWAFGKDWVSQKLANGDLAVRFMTRKHPGGTTVANECVQIRNGSTILATSPFVSTYAATPTIVWVEAIIPQGASTPFTDLNVDIRFRANTATENGKTSYWSSRAEIYDAAATSGTLIHACGQGGLSADAYSSTGSISDAAFSFIEGIQPTVTFLEFGLNNPLSHDAAAMTTVLQTLIARIRAVAPQTTIVLLAVHGRWTENPAYGGGGPEPYFCEAAYDAQQLTSRSLFLNLCQLMPNVEVLTQPYSTAFWSWFHIPAGRRILKGMSCYQGTSTYVALTTHIKVDSEPNQPINNATDWKLLDASISGSGDQRFPKFTDANVLFYDQLHPNMAGGRFMALGVLALLFMVRHSSGQATIAASLRDELQPELLSLPSDGSLVALEDSLGDLDAKIGTPATTTFSADLAVIANTAGSALTQATAAAASADAASAAVTSVTHGNAALKTLVDGKASQASVDALPTDLASAAQPRINEPPAKAYTLKVSAKTDGTLECPDPLRLAPGATNIPFGIDMSPIYGSVRVFNVGDPTVSGGDVTVTELGPHDWIAMAQTGGTVTAGERHVVIVPVTMRTGETEQVRVKLWGLTPAE